MTSWEMGLLTTEDHSNKGTWMHRRAVKLGAPKEPATYLWFHLLCSPTSGHKAELPHTEIVTAPPSRIYNLLAFRAHM